ncbi:uncharacterized protein N7482_006586 [Penicillium canariense]|uniref:Pinin/SDK/MemA protein domain-containing protein n=1 Tax=Penicillium canariense TaxID=189055 RepID=A0A9W9HY27_9EURO|nr:uncharacterized protein N7482_006586 [Penicillium canariense]KAJ5159582.1 hypothetical protein N7482_006586 [Penicillium canariense]
MSEGYGDFSDASVNANPRLSFCADTRLFFICRTLASAVAVPEQDHERQSPEVSAKRRQSSVSEHETKRRRLSSQGDISPHAQRQRHSPPAPAAERRPPRQGREEDRKRGQRLFGALLGTLSQSSTSAAQKRRADIEKRQQDKLKSQADEYDGLKKRRKERRALIRRKEQPFYEREALQTRHSNLTAAAHFLKTRAEPVLVRYARPYHLDSMANSSVVQFYKPWQLRAGDEAVIQEQIEEAEATVIREIAEFDARYPPEAFVVEKIDPISQESAGPQGDSDGAQQQAELASAQPSAPEPAAIAKEPEETQVKTDAYPRQELSSEPTKTDTVPTSEDDAADPKDAHRGHHDDDGGEMMEDNEDTVIY